ncbi:hypothetical protein WA171_003636 [Blastocystis sp. BT1]
MELVEQFVDAARFGELGTLQQMVQQGFNVDLKDEFGTTALHNASANGHLDCVQFLINSGSHLIPNDSGNTPLHRAVLLQQIDVVKMILNKMSDVDVLQKNMFGQSAVDIAFQTGNESIIDILLSHDSAKALEESVGYTENEEA